MIYLMLSLIFKITIQTNFRTNFQIINVQKNLFFLSINLIQYMEEFYRRKYLSPTYSRASSYLDTLQKDKTVAELRKELQQSKQMQEKFDDLCLEIVKLQRQNKKFQSQQSQVQGEYLQKIKRNKNKITQLKQTILDSREDIENRNRKIANMETDNDHLLQELQRIKKETEDNRKEKQDFSQNIKMQDELVVELKNKIEEQKKKAIEWRKESQLKSEQLQKNYQQLKKNQLKLKEEEILCEQTRGKIQQLGKQFQEWQKKVQISRVQLQSLKGSLNTQDKENQKNQFLLREMTEDKDKRNDNWELTEKEMKKLILKEKESSQKIKAGQLILIQSINNLQKDQLYLQKMTIREVELKKGNQRMEEILKNLSETLGEQQESYTRIISHMKQSIVQDQKAIESLSKQATLLQNIVN